MINEQIWSRKNINKKQCDRKKYVSYKSFKYEKVCFLYYIFSLLSPPPYGSVLAGGGDSAGGMVVGGGGGGVLVR